MNHAIFVLSSCISNSIKLVNLYCSCHLKLCSSSRCPLFSLQLWLVINESFFSLRVCLFGHPGAELLCSASFLCFRYFFHWSPITPLVFQSSSYQLSLEHLNSTPHFWPIKLIILNFFTVIFYFLVFSDRTPTLTYQHMRLTKSKLTAPGWTASKLPIRNRVLSFYIEHKK